MLYEIPTLVYFSINFTNLINAMPKKPFQTCLMTLVSLVLIGTSSYSQAQVTGSRLATAMHNKTANPQKHIQQLTQQAQAWDQAIVRKDQQAIAANMADDFRQIGPNGELENKDSFIQGLLDPQLSIHPYTVEDFEIRLYGKVALLSGRTRMQGEYQGKSFTSHYRYIDVYVLRDKKWQIVSVQITRLAS